MLIILLSAICVLPYLHQVGLLLKVVVGSQHAKLSWRVSAHRDDRHCHSWLGKTENIPHSATRRCTTTTGVNPSPAHYPNPHTLIFNWVVTTFFSVEQVQRIIQTHNLSSLTELSLLFFCWTSLAVFLSAIACFSFFSSLSYSCKKIFPKDSFCFTTEPSPSAVSCCNFSTFTIKTCHYKN